MTVKTGWKSVLQRLWGEIKKENIFPCFCCEMLCFKILFFPLGDLNWQGIKETHSFTHSSATNPLLHSLYSHLVTVGEHLDNGIRLLESLHRPSAGYSIRLRQEGL